MAKNRAMARAKRRAHRRVVREERVQPTPETLAKLKPWTMAELLRLGPEAGGIDPSQHEAAVEIVDAFKALTKELGFRPLQLERVGRGSIGMGARALRLATIYLAWAEMFERRFMRRAHMNPAEAVQAHLDLGGPFSLAMHFGTFQLTDEAIDAPLIALDEALEAAAIPPERFRTLQPGEVWEL